VEVCRELNKSLYIDSRSIQQTLNIADRLGYFPMPKDTLVEEHDLSYIPRESLVVAATGCQGEYRSSLKRIAQREHRLFKIHSGDLVVFSSRMIPGNEQAIVHMTSDLENQGAKIVTARECPSIHVSGHAYGGELEKLMDILKPRYYVPIHGNHSHLLANKEVAKQSRTATENVFKIENGSVIHLKDGVLTVPQQLDIKWEYVDDYSNLLVSQNVLRERLKIGEQGLFTVQGVYSLQNKAFLRNLEITAHGLELPRHLDADTWFEDAAEELMKSILGWKLTLDSEDQCNESLRIQLRKKLSLIFSKKPVVISRLMFLK
jgi:ribonuclease J